VSVTVDQAEQALRRLGRGRWGLVREIAHEGVNDGIAGPLIVAIGIRESGCQNIVGDGGHGRGWLQDDDRSHAAWLRRHAGCRSGSWTIAKGHNALEPGYCPSLTASTLYAIELLRGNMAYARSIGVPEHDRLRFAIAAYNCGAGNAEKAWRRGGIRNIDAYTTGRDYSRDVLATKPVVIAAARKLRWPVT
jgi:hypothetical protein